jgi:hypothetical protein
MRKLFGALMLCAACAASPVKAAEITYTLTGSFDVSLNGTEYDGLNATLTGTGNPAHVFFPAGPGTPVVYLPVLTADVAGYGNATLTDTFLYFSNNTTGINGFYDIAIEQDLMGWAGFSPYNSVSPVAPRSVTFDYGGHVNTTLGNADILHGSNLVFSAVISGAPEPSAWALLLMGFAGTGLALRGLRPRKIESAAD